MSLYFGKNWSVFSQKHIRTSTDPRENQDQNLDQNKDQNLEPDLSQNDLNLPNNDFSSFKNYCEEEFHRKTQTLPRNDLNENVGNFSTKSCASESDHPLIDKDKMADVQTLPFPSSVSTLSSSVSGYVQSVNSYLGSYVGLSSGQTGKGSSSVFGFVAGKLSDVYEDANRKIQGTRQIVRNVELREVSGYVYRLSKELPALPRLRSAFAPRARDIAEDCENETCSLSNEESSEADPKKNHHVLVKESAGLDGAWPHGSICTIKDENITVFQQKLIDFTEPLLQLTLLTNTDLVARLPETRLGKVFSVFFVSVADRERPSPTSAMVTVCEAGLAVIIADLSLALKLTWSQTAAAEVGLAGQTVRMIRDENEEVLTVFTYSGRLTQQLCQEIVKAQSSNYEKLSNVERLGKEMKVCAKNVPECSAKEEYLRRFEAKTQQDLQNKPKCGGETAQKGSSKAENSLFEICQHTVGNIISFTNESLRENGGNYRQTIQDLFRNVQETLMESQNFETKPEPFVQEKMYELCHRSASNTRQVLGSFMSLTNVNDGNSNQTMKDFPENVQKSDTFIIVDHKSSICEKNVEKVHGDMGESPIKEHILEISQRFETEAEQVWGCKVEVGEANVQRSSPEPSDFLEGLTNANFKEHEGNSRDDTEDLSKLVPEATFLGLDLEVHPLLRSDLMLLSLDWTSRIPDLLLPSGFRVRSWFKRALADLLYLVHGNMEGLDCPGLAEVQPLVFTGARLKSDAGGDEELGQFLLTDTHLCSMREGLLRSSPGPGSSGVAGLRVRARSEIRCVFARSVDGCVELEVVFNVRKHLEKNRRIRRRSVDQSELKERSPSWKIRFGDSSDAALVLKHLWD